MWHRWGHNCPKAGCSYTHSVLTQCDGWNIRSGAKSWHHNPHEQDRGHVDVVGRVEVVAHTQVQGQDQQPHQHLPSAAPHTHRQHALLQLAHTTAMTACMPRWLADSLPPASLPITLQLLVLVDHHHQHQEATHGAAGAVQAAVSAGLVCQRTLSPMREPRNAPSW